MGKRTVQFFLTEKWTQRVSIFTSPIQVIGLWSMHEGLNVKTKLLEFYHAQFYAEPEVVILTEIFSKAIVWYSVILDCLYFSVVGVSV